MSKLTHILYTRK